MAIETLRSLALSAGHADMSVPAVPTLQKRASVAYDAGAGGRRNIGWNSTRQGQNTLLITNSEQIRARSREAIRNNGWGTAAINRFESNIIGTGIQPHWQHPDPMIVETIHKEWKIWCKRSDYLGQNNFYAQQGIVARECFEAGEVFARYRLRRKKDKMRVPFQIQLIEPEQLPLFRNAVGYGDAKNDIRMGIEFDSEMRRVAYHFYKEHPGESMLYPSDAMTYISVNADEIAHVFRPLRAGQLRGEPYMVSVLTLLYELDQYDDATLAKKKIQAMFAAFIQKPAPEVDVVPLDPNKQPTNADIGTAVAKIETGTLQELFPGEEVVFPHLPNEADLDTFMSWQLHKFAAGCGLTFEQLTGNLEHVNYSSIRAGMLEFRRACEQFQVNVMVHQFCEPVALRWLDEAVISGALKLPGYVEDPTQYQEITWVPAGWAWVDPLKESQAALNDVRSGFESRTAIIRGKGGDPSVVDAQIVTERRREQDLGLVLDSNGNQILIGRETQPTIDVEVDPDEESAAETGTPTGPSKNKGKPIAPAQDTAPLQRQAVPKPIPAKKPKEPGKTNGLLQ